MVRRLSKSGRSIRKSLTNEKCEVLHMIFGLFTEVGELGDNIKKWVFYEKELDRINLKEEFGDIEFFKERLHQIFGITSQMAKRANVKKLSVRYKNFVYRNKRAHKRADKA